MSATLPVALLTSCASQAASLPTQLDDAGFACQTFRRSADLLHGLCHGPFSLLLVEATTQDWHAADVIRAIRNLRSRHLPILMLTDSADEERVLEAFLAGADDCVAWPQRPRELLARMRALSRRPAPGAPTRGGNLRVGPYTLHTQTQQVTRADGKCIGLTTKEFELALLLFANAGEVLSGDRIEKAVWGRELPPLSRALSGLVSRLRRTLRLHEENGVLLSVVYARGYRLDVLPGRHASTMRRRHASR